MNRLAKWLRSLTQNALACWLIRLCGGGHKWRRLRNGEQLPQTEIERKHWRICERCLRVRPVKSRAKKEAT